MEPKIIMRKVDDLIPYARNAKKHPDDQVLKIASSIKEFGFTQPVLTDGENGILAGHGRVMAARKLNMDTVPTIDLKHLSKAQRKAYILADNRIAQSDWDNDLLKLEFEELKELDFDLSLTGFDFTDINEFNDSDDNYIAAYQNDDNDENDNTDEDITLNNQDEQQKTGIITIPLLINDCPRSIYKKFMDLKAEIKLKNNYNVLEYLLNERDDNV